jgi:hypothetical protein
VSLGATTQVIGFSAACGRRVVKSVSHYNSGIWSLHCNPGILRSAVRTPAFDPLHCVEQAFLYDQLQLMESIALLTVASALSLRVQTLQ